MTLSPWWLFSRRKVPAHVPTDTVIPVHYFDDTAIFRTFVLHTVLIFDAALDAQALKGGLERVVDREGWRKFGARLRRHDDGTLHYHIPARFATDRPALGFTHVDARNTALQDDAVGARIPRPPPADNTRPAVVGRIEDVAPWLADPCLPRTLDDYLYADRPVLGLQIRSFRDATVVILHVTHLAGDARALGAVLDAWVLALRGRDNEIPAPQGADDVDLLASLGCDASVPHALASFRLSAWGLVSYALRNLLMLFWYRPESRIMCVPAAFLEHLRSEAIGELRKESEGNEHGARLSAFLSEGDVLVAWFARLALCCVPANSSRTVAIMSAYDQRRVLEPDLLAPGRPYLGNCMTTLTALLPVHAILGRSLAYTAEAVRQAVVTLGTRPQVEAVAALVRQDPKNKMLPLFGDPSAQFLFFTNWQKARMFNVNFSATLVPNGETAKGNTIGEPECCPPVLPSCIIMTQSPYSFADGFGIPGKDCHGNYWIMGSRVSGLWEKMEAAILTERY